MMNFMINPEDIQKELSKKKNELIALSNQTIPMGCKKGFLATAAKLKNSGYFKDSYKICYYEDYIPMMGRVYRMFVYDLDAVLADFNAMEITNRAATKEEIFCYLARKNQLISIYYDDADVLAIMGRPCFEIYDGNDIDRFFEGEGQDLARRAIEILASKQ